jgi:tetratricopeptide (TPR) repeat protein
MDVRALGDSLGVAALLQGSVRREGGQVRVTAQLVDVSSGYTLWSDQFDRELSGILQVQEQIARSIADALQLTLSASSVAGRAPDVGAHDLYLLGLNSFHQRDVAAAIDYFRRATAVDPAYAEAWGGLAMAHAVSPAYVGRYGDTDRAPISAREGADSTRVAAARAKQLDDRLAEPYAALCQSLAYLEYMWEDAERECDAATLRNPSSAIAHQWRAELLLIVRRFAEADSAIARSLELDRRALLAPIVAANISMASGDLVEAERRLRAHLPADPSPTTGNLLTALLVMRGDTASLRAHLENVDPRLAPMAAQLVAARTDATARASVLSVVAAGVSAGLAGLAVESTTVKALYGDYDGVLPLLEESLARREFNLPLLIGMPVLDPLRGNPRFQRVVDGLRLTPYW